MPSFSDYAIMGIKKHPEIFSALEEFERTQKIPKYSYRKRLDVTLDENILREFKEYCKNKGYSMSRLIERYIKKELKKN